MAIHTLRCVSCGNTQTLPDITPAQHDRYFYGKELAQVVFPDWSVDERESLITLMCIPCVNAVYSNL